MSPTSAETVLLLNPTLNATIRATAFGLTTTVRQRMEHYSQQVAEASMQIVQLK
jgi:hypothetical protein